MKLISRSSRQGFTLIEVVISSALMSMILAASYICFNASISSRNLMEPRLEIIQKARVAMAMMTADLRAACPLDPNAEFLGVRRMLGEAVADNLDFATHNYTPNGANEGDFCELSYYLEPDPRTGQLTLWRRRNPMIALDPLSGGSKEEIATGLRGMRLEYFNGTYWYDTWGEDGRGKQRNSQRTQPNLTGLPQAVRITLLFDTSDKPAAAEPGREASEPPPPLVFETIARLNLASASAAAAGTGGNTGGDTTGQAQPGAAGGAY